MLNSLYNTEISEKRCVGYCWHHHCYVTVTQIKQKECLKKQCNALERYEHEYWRQRELAKARKKSGGGCHAMA
jgi:hypothetical protein